MKVEDCDLLFLVSARVMTGSKKLTAWVVPKKVEESGEENSDSFTLDGYMLLADTGKKYNYIDCRIRELYTSIQADDRLICLNMKNLLSPGLSFCENPSQKY